LAQGLGFDVEVRNVERNNAEKQNVEKVTENVEFIWPFLITPAGVR
jgi:hypothetical protein